MTNSNTYNYMAFVPEDVKKGMVNKLIKTLLEMNEESDEYFNDIHITSDSYSTIVEWIWVPHSREWGGEFMFVSEDEHIEKDYIAQNDDEEKE